MKKIIATMVLVLAGIVGASAQQTANEGYVGYSFLRQNVEFNQTPTLRFNEDTDSHGFVASYTRYVDGSTARAGGFGFTAEVGANFDNDNASLVTAMGGVTLKARNFKYVAPSIKVLGGVARQEVNRTNIFDTSDVTSAFSVGAGLDFKTKRTSRYALHVGADYLNTGFNGERQNAVRFTSGITF